MKKIYYIIVFLCGCFLISFSVNAETISNAKITNLMIDKNLGDKAFINLDIAHSTSSPTCAVNSTWDFVLPLTSALDEKIFAVLVTAWIAGSKVTYVGADNCDVHYNLESVKRIETK